MNMSLALCVHQPIDQVSVAGDFIRGFPFRQDKLLTGCVNLNEHSCCVIKLRSPRVNDNPSVG